MITPPPLPVHQPPYLSALLGGNTDTPTQSHDIQNPVIPHESDPSATHTFYQPPPPVVDIFPLLDNITMNHTIAAFSEPTKDNTTFMLTTVVHEVPFEDLLFEEASLPVPEINLVYTAPPPPAPILIPNVEVPNIDLVFDRATQPETENNPSSITNATTKATFTDPPTIPPEPTTEIIIDVTAAAPETPILRHPKKKNSQRKKKTTTLAPSTIPPVTDDVVLPVTDVASVPLIQLGISPISPLLTRPGFPFNTQVLPAGRHLSTSNQKSGGGLRSITSSKSESFSPPAIRFSHTRTVSRTNGGPIKVTTRTNRGGRGRVGNNIAVSLGSAGNGSVKRANGVGVRLRPGTNVAAQRAKPAVISNAAKTRSAGNAISATTGRRAAGKPKANNNPASKNKPEPLQNRKILKIRGNNTNRASVVNTASGVRQRPRSTQSQSQINNQNRSIANSQRKNVNKSE